jgi:hypothetical protein
MSYFVDWISRQSRLLVIALAPLLIVEYKTHQQAVVDYATIAGFVVSLLISLPTRMATQIEVEGAARRLRRLVRQNWEDRLLILQGDNDGADVPYIRQSGVEDLNPGSEASWPWDGSRRLFDNYLALLDNSKEAPARLVITGSPGSGKSIAAYSLIIDILRRRIKSPSEDVAIVPIPLGVVGWDGEQELVSWLIDQLADGYRIVRPVAKRLVEDGYILPVLDGLDETGLTISQRIMDKLDSPAARRVADGALIITCQRLFYETLAKAGNGLRDAVVITMQALPPDKIRSYMRIRLERARGRDSFDAERFQRVLRQDDSCLIQTLGRPLMLNLAIGALVAGTSSLPRMSQYKSVSRLESHLIDGMLPAALAGTPKYPLPRVIGEMRKPVMFWWRKPKHYTVEEIRIWLSSIATAKKGNRRTKVVFNPGALWRLGDESRIRSIHTVLAIVTGLLVAGLAAEAKPGITGAALTACTAVVALGFALWAGRRKDTKPHRLSLRQYATPAGLARLVAVAALGVLCAAGGAYDGGVSTAITSGIGGTLAIAVVIGLTGNIAQIIDPQLILRNDLLFGSLFGLGVSVAAALPGGLTGGIAGGLRLNELITIPGSATLAIVLAMAAGVTLGSHAWTRYALMIIMVAPTGRIPWRLMHFIRWCYAANLLRVSGAGFELRHEEILKALG